MKHSFFLRTYLMNILLVLMAFVIAGQVFLVQMRSYADDEKQESAYATAASVAELAAGASQYRTEEIDDLLFVYLKQTAVSGNCTILLTAPDGQAGLLVDPEGKIYQIDNRIERSVIETIEQAGTYYANGSLGGLVHTGYVVGVPSKTADGVTQSVVFVVMDNSKAVEALEQISNSFMVILTFTLFGAMLVSYFTSERITRPLKVMAHAAREYAQGNYEVRVPEDSMCREIDELAGSFNSMARDLQKLDELTKGFIGNVSHEFKTPMTTIGGFVDGMLDGTIPCDQQQKYLHIISDEVKRLSRMVGSMLDAAKLQSGELLINPAPFDFTEMSSEIVLSFEQKITAKHLDVDVDFADRLTVLGDRDQIYRVVYNLVDNAVKFINEGGTLRLTAYPAGSMCEFSIMNTGGGIEPEEIPHLFDRFYKTDRSRSRDRTGAGLGLYIVKNIINLHGGDISVRSDGGETEFSFTLPLAPAFKPKKLGDTGPIR